MIKCYLNWAKLHQDLNDVYSNDSVMHVFWSLDIFQMSVHAHAHQKQAVPKQQLPAVACQCACSLHMNVKHNQRDLAFPYHHIWHQKTSFSSKGETGPKRTVLQQHYQHTTWCDWATERVSLQDFQCAFEDPYKQSQHCVELGCDYIKSL